MASNYGIKVSPVSLKKMLRSRGISFWRSLAIFVVSVFVAILIVISLSVSVGAIVEKIKISHGISQIIDIVDLSRRVANAERGFGVSPGEDILVRLDRMQQIQVADDSSGRLKTLVNPWGGTLTAETVGGNLFRLETVVPSRACKRLISLLTESANSLGIRQIDAKGSDESMRQIYADSNHNNLTNEEIAAGCHSDQLLILDFIFTLR